MNYLKNNKVFIFLSSFLIVTMIALSSTLIKDKFVKPYRENTETNYTTTTIASFDASFNESDMSIVLRWKVPVVDKEIEKIAIYHDNTFLKDVSDSYNMKLFLKDYDFETGSNDFELRVTLEDDEILEKSETFYLNEVFDFKVTSHLANDKVLYTASYRYHKDRPVVAPDIRFIGVSEPFAVKFVGSEILEEDKKFIYRTSTYELDYSLVKEGNYTLDMKWNFNEYNLGFDYKATVYVSKSTNE